MTKELFKRDERLTNLISDVVRDNSEFSHLRELNIIGITKDKQKQTKKKKVYADTEKLNDKHFFLTNIDFVITFYPISRSLDDKHLKRLIIHELLHIGYNEKTKKKSIIPHDIEDFKTLIDRYGTDWIEN